ncbi:MAG: hypothetical protein JNM84_26955 [Planctomycetes bacterium]|nr:hypothetical protein [Planctomycetota bacterium]
MFRSLEGKGEDAPIDVVAPCARRSSIARVEGTAEDAGARRAECTRVALGHRLAVGIAAGTAVLVAWRDAHPGLYGDGPLFVELWRQSIWVQAHFLLLPLAIALRAMLGPLLVLDRAQSIRAVSGLGAVLGAGATQLAAARLAGPLAALAATLLLLASPALRFYAGAVEVHALALGCVAVACAWVSRPQPTRRRARAALALSAALCASAHVTLLSAALPLLCLHAEAEREARRALRWRELFVSAVWAGVALLLLLALVLALDRLGAPAAFAEYSAVEQYRKAMVAWNERIPRPDLAALAVLEVLAPLGALPWLALPGFVVLLRSRAWLAASGAAWFLLLGAAALKVGAREHGAYVLPAGVALSCAAAVALRSCARARSFASLASLALALLAQALALRAWAAQHGLRDVPSAAIGPWPIARAELGLGAPGALDALAALAPAALWWGSALCAGVAAGMFAIRARSERELPRSRAAACAVLALVALGAQLAASEAARARWPVLWRQELVDVASWVRARAGPEDELLAFAPNVETKWTLDHFLDRPWLDLGELDGAPEAAQAAWIEAADQRIARARERGARTLLPDDALAALLFDAARRPQALALVQRWLQSDLIARLPPRLPFTEAFLREMLPAPP